MENVPEDLKDLVNLRVSREQRLACAHLGEDAADRPHVDTSRVLATTEQNLWSTVPQSNNLMSVCAQRDAKGAGETKIGQLEVALTIDQQVLRFQIAVQDPVTVAVANAFAQLAHELLDDLIAQAETAKLSVGSLRQ